MTTSNWDKFKLLSWKNWLIQVRHTKRTVFELVLPLVATSLLLIIRYFCMPGNVHPPTYYEGLNTLDMSSYFPYPRPLMALAYAPANPVLDEVIRNAAGLIDDTEPLKVFSNATVRDLESFLRSRNIFVGVVFPDSYSSLESLPEKIEFKLKFPAELRTSGREFLGPKLTWMLAEKFAPYSMDGPRNPHSNDGGTPPGYYREGFIAVQSAISHAIVKAKNGSVSEDLYLHRLPGAEFRNDMFWTIVASFFPILIVATFASPAVTLIKYVTLEKESQLKEAMKIMGLPNWLHWTSWFTKGWCQFIIIVTLMTAILKVSGA